MNSSHQGSDLRRTNGRGRHGREGQPGLGAGDNKPCWEEKTNAPRPLLREAQGMPGARGLWARHSGTLDHPRELTFSVYGHPLENENFSTNLEAPESPKQMFQAAPVSLVLCSPPTKGPPLVSACLPSTTHHPRPSSFEHLASFSRSCSSTNSPVAHVAVKDLSGTSILALAEVALFSIFC